MFVYRLFALFTFIFTLCMCGGASAQQVLRFDADPATLITSDRHDQNVSL